MTEISENRRVIYRLLFRPLPLDAVPAAVNGQLLSRVYRLAGSLGPVALTVIRCRCHDYARAGFLEMAEYAAARDFWNAYWSVG